MNAEQVLFWVFAVSTVASASAVIFSRNPIASAMSLVATFFFLSGIYVLLWAHTIAALQVLVYAGAIMVLFLFVIMLLNLDELPRLANFDWRVGIAFAGGTALLALLTYVLASGLDAMPSMQIGPAAAASGTAKAVAWPLFTTYALPFEIVGLLLLVATIGAVLLAKKRFV